MSSNRNLIEKKLVLAAEIVASDEYKKADALLKKVDKLKNEVMEYCQKNNLREMSVDRNGKSYRVEYKVKQQ
jgi:hypothetical protein